jgi:hypothetical protein
MLLLPSTTNHTVGVTGEVLCMPDAQLSMEPLGRVVGDVGEVEPMVDAPAPAAPPLPTTKLPPGPEGVVEVVPAVPADPGEAAVLEAPGPRLAEPEPIELPLQAAAEIKPRISAGIAVVSNIAARDWFE